MKQIYSDYKQKFNQISSIIQDMSSLIFEDIPNQMIDINREVILLLINYECSIRLDVINKIKQLVKAVVDKEQEAFFVLSNPFDLLQDIKKEYKESILLFSPMKFYYEDETLIQASHIKVSNKKQQNFDYKQYMSLLNMGQFDAALILLKDYVEEAIYSYQIDSFEIKNLLKNAIYTLTYTFEELHIETDDLRKIYFKQFDESKSSVQFIAYLYKILEEIQKILSKNSMNLQEKMMKKMLSYIEEHYNEPLDLGELANRFNFNYNYLSTYFNSHNEEGFSEYLNKIRIEKAGQLLKNTSYSIAEVSDLVGYSDQSYFCRVFKKNLGITPSQFRKNLQFI